MLAVVWYDVVGLIGIIAACGGLYYLSSRIEPHWVSKDQTRFLTVAQELDQRGLPIGRKRDVRVHVADDADALLVSRRSRLRPSSSMWTIKSKSTISRNRNVVRAAPRVTRGRRRLSVPPRPSAQQGDAPPRCDARDHRRRGKAAAASASSTAPSTDWPPTLRKLPALQEVRHRISQPIEVDQERVVTVR